MMPARMTATMAPTLPLAAAPPELPAALDPAPAPAAPDAPVAPDALAAALVPVAAWPEAAPWAVAVALALAAERRCSSLTERLTLVARLAAWVVSWTPSSSSEEPRASADASMAAMAASWPLDGAACGVAASELLFSRRTVVLTRAFDSVLARRDPERADPDIAASEAEGPSPSRTMLLRALKRSSEPRVRVEGEVPLADVVSETRAI